MSLKIYIDTNIFLDSILDRDSGIARKVLLFLGEKNFEIILNDISIINIHYFSRKGIEPKKLKEYINTFLDEYIIVSVDEDILRNAINSDFKDFEDAVQYFCAKEKKARLIITNDKKGFQNSNIDTISSSDFYNQYVQ
ncbi:MAG: PIN domain-containing protein [Campylobacterales bacterium]|nr:PIN domain-containing protein [Campylobacterales bacterium]